MNRQQQCLQAHVAWLWPEKWYVGQRQVAVGGFLVRPQRKQKRDIEHNMSQNKVLIWWHHCLPIFNNNVKTNKTLQHYQPSVCNLLQQLPAWTDVLINLPHDRHNKHTNNMAASEGGANPWLGMWSLTWKRYQRALSDITKGWFTELFILSCVFRKVKPNKCKVAFFDFTDSTDMYCIIRGRWSEFYRMWGFQPTFQIWLYSSMINKWGNSSSTTLGLCWKYLFLNVLINLFFILVNVPVLPRG